jgi:hypothetical protein
MRKVLLVATLVALGLAGTAYAATVVTNVYVLGGSVTPKKSGTKAHPVPIATTSSYTVNTKPAGERPNVIQKIVFTAAGVQAHLNSFPTCSTSVLTAKGPSGCPAGSLIGTGHFIAEVGPASSQSGPQIIPSCRVELSVYNGGGDSLSYYVYETKASGECPQQTPSAFEATLAVQKANNPAKETLVQTINVPVSVRHPANNTAIDAATLQAVVNIPLKVKTTKPHKVKGKKVAGKRIGLFETIFCPANHKRNVTETFTPEHGSAQTVTLNLACK